LSRKPGRYGNENEIGKQPLENRKPD